MRFEYSALRARERAEGRQQPTHNAHFFNHSLVIGLTVNRKWILPENEERKKAHEQRKEKKNAATYLQITCNFCVDKEVRSEAKWRKNQPSRKWNQFSICAWTVWAGLACLSLSQIEKSQIKRPYFSSVLLLLLLSSSSAAVVFRTKHTLNRPN